MLVRTAVKRAALLELTAKLRRYRIGMDSLTSLNV